MKQTFGEFIEQFPLAHNSLELSFTERFQPSKQSWRNINLSSEFLAEYFLNFLALDENKPESEECREEIKHALTYVGNELLENATKFHEAPQHYPVKFGIHFLETSEIIKAVIFTKNSISSQKVENFQALITELLSRDTNELYIQQIEKTAADEDSEASGLGLLTIINDYDAKLGWKFASEPSNPQITIVTTMAQVDV
ncbi:MAG: DUF6272 family protein [Nostocaceae cyanobacterium]|nr:DUF6272 family protein [Nostocaceae cyanobacterium]